MFAKKGPNPWQGLHDASLRVNLKIKIFQKIYKKITCHKSRYPWQSCFLRLMGSSCSSEEAASQPHDAVAKHACRNTRSDTNQSEIEQSTRKNAADVKHNSAQQASQPQDSQVHITDLSELENMHEQLGKGAICTVHLYRYHHSPPSAPLRYRDKDSGRRSEANNQASSLASSLTSSASASTLVALKRISRSKVAAAGKVLNVLNEKKILLAIDHPLIVTMYATVCLRVCVCLRVLAERVCG